MKLLTEMHISIHVPDNTLFTDKEVTALEGAIEDAVMDALDTLWAEDQTIPVNTTYEVSK